MKMTLEMEETPMVENIRILQQIVDEMNRFPTPVRARRNPEDKRPKNDDTLSIAS